MIYKDDIEELNKILSRLNKLKVQFIKNADQIRSNGTIKYGDSSNDKFFSGNISNEPRKVWLSKRIKKK